MPAIKDTFRVNQDDRHPWSAEPGWSQLYMQFEDLERLRSKMSEAEGKFWKVWAFDERQHAVVLYKPAGITRDWHDDPERYRGTPRGHGSGFKVGDEVYTDISSTKSRQRITRHRITEIRTGQIGQTGLTFRVDPPPPGTAYLKDDPGGAPREYAGWIDSAWFRKVEP